MIEGKVAQVLNSRELVINIGRDNGVALNMRFAVLASRPLEIRDPDSNEVIGEIDREKVRVEVSEVQDSFSICRTYQIRRAAARGFSPFGGLLEQWTPAHDVPITLKAEDSALPAPLSEGESYVKRGDRVKQLLPENPSTPS